MPKRKVPSLAMALSLPLQAGYGKTLTALYLYTPSLILYRFDYVSLPWCTLNFPSACRSRGHLANKPIKEKKARKSKKEDDQGHPNENEHGQEHEPPRSPTMNEQYEVIEHHSQQEPEHREIEVGIFDDMDLGVLDGDSSGGSASLSYMDEKPEKLRASSSVDGGSVRASSRRSSRMSVESLTRDMPETYSADGEESVARSGRTSLASSRRSKLSSVFGDEPFGIDNGLYTDFSLRDEPESHPSFLKNHSQLPSSQVPSASSSCLHPPLSCLLCVAVNVGVCSDLQLCMSSAFQSMLCKSQLKLLITCLTRTRSCPSKIWFHLPRASSAPHVSSTPCSSSCEKSLLLDLAVRCRVLSPDVSHWCVGTRAWFSWCRPFSMLTSRFTQLPLHPTTPNNIAFHVASALSMHLQEICTTKYAHFQVKAISSE